MKNNIQISKIRKIGFVFLVISLVFSGCKQKDKDIFSEAITKVTLVDQGKIAFDIEADIIFDTTQMTNEEIIDSANYKHFQMTMVVQFDNKEQTVINMVLVNGARSLQTEIYKTIDFTLLKLPMTDLFIVLEEADFLNEVVKGMSLQKELINILSVNKESSIEFWHLLMKGKTNEIKQKKILTSIGTQKIIIYNQTITEELVRSKIDYIRSKSNTIDTWLNMYQEELNFAPNIAIETYIDRKNNIIKQVFIIDGVHLVGKVDESSVYPISDYCIIVTIDFSELGENQRIKLPDITKDNKVTKDMLYRIIDQLGLKF